MNRITTIILLLHAQTILTTATPVFPFLSCLTTDCLGGDEQSISPLKTDHLTNLPQQLLSTLSDTSIQDFYTLESLSRTNRVWHDTITQSDRYRLLKHLSEHCRSRNNNSTYFHQFLSPVPNVYWKYRVSEYGEMNVDRYGDVGLECLNGLVDQGFGKWVPQISRVSVRDWDGRGRVRRNGGVGVRNWMRVVEEMVRRPLKSVREVMVTSVESNSLAMVGGGGDGENDDNEMEMDNGHENSVITLRDTDLARFINTISPHIESLILPTPIQSAWQRTLTSITNNVDKLQNLTIAFGFQEEDNWDPQGDRQRLSNQFNDKITKLLAAIAASKSLRHVDLTLFVSTTLSPFLRSLPMRIVDAVEKSETLTSVTIRVDDAYANALFNEDDEEPLMGWDMLGSTAYADSTREFWKLGCVNRLESLSLYLNVLDAYGVQGFVQCQESSTDSRLRELTISTFLRYKSIEDERQLPPEPRSVPPPLGPFMNDHFDILESYKLLFRSKTLPSKLTKLHVLLTPELLFGYQEYLTSFLSHANRLESLLLQLPFRPFEPYGQDRMTALENSLHQMDMSIDETIHDVTYSEQLEEWNLLKEQTQIPDRISEFLINLGSSSRDLLPRLQKLWFIDFPDIVKSVAFKKSLIGLVSKVLYREDGLRSFGLYKHWHPGYMGRENALRITPVRGIPRRGSEAGNVGNDVMNVLGELFPKEMMKSKLWKLKELVWRPVLKREYNVVWIDRTAEWFKSATNRETFVMNDILLPHVVGY